MWLNTCVFSFHTKRHGLNGVSVLIYYPHTCMWRNMIRMQPLHLPVNPADPFLPALDLTLDLVFVSSCRHSQLSHTHTERRRPCSSCLNFLRFVFAGFSWARGLSHTCHFLPQPYLDHFPQAVLMSNCMHIYTSDILGQHRLSNPHLS